LHQTQHHDGAVLCRDDDAKFPPKNCFFHRQADSHYASNLNHKVYPVMRIEDKEKPAYLLGYAYALPTGSGRPGMEKFCSLQPDDFAKWG
jgi:hypothetical protein